MRRSLVTTGRSASHPGVPGTSEESTGRRSGRLPADAISGLATAVSVSTTGNRAPCLGTTNRGHFLGPCCVGVNPTPPGIGGRKRYRDTPPLLIMVTPALDRALRANLRLTPQPLQSGQTRTKMTTGRPDPSGRR